MIALEDVYICLTIFILSIRTPQLLTILVLKFDLGLHCLLKPVCPNIYDKYGNLHDVHYNQKLSILTL